MRQTTIPEASTQVPPITEAPGRVMANITQPMKPRPLKRCGRAWPNGRKHAGPDHGPQPHDGRIPGAQPPGQPGGGVAHG